MLNQVKATRKQKTRTHECTARLIFFETNIFMHTSCSEEVKQDNLLGWKNAGDSLATCVLTIHMRTNE